MRKEYGYYLLLHCNNAYYGIPAWVDTECGVDW